MIAQTNFEKAEKLYSENKLSEAKKLFDDCLKTNPNHSKTIEYLGDIAGKEKKWDEAIYCYEKLKDKYPSTANYHYKFGGAMGMKAKNVNKFKALGMIDDIESAFLTAAKLDRKHVDTRWALVILYLELPGIIGGSETKAQKYATELMNLSNIDGYLARGYIDVYFQRYSKAEYNYKKAHEIGNSNTTYEKLYDLYLNKMKSKTKANQLKIEFEK
ncbi:MAG: tetratricopeptide (TPR) repeat protein [Flavobacterium sp.]|jgi:tetratricopeptide (TPR) repeat protein